MKVKLFDFQEDALKNLQTKIKGARYLASEENPQALSFSAPTGAGKTIVMTAFFESIFFGEADFEAQPDATILWISDMPELNEQTKLKIQSKSDRIHASQLINFDSSYDNEVLEKGKIYFINTQKLGSDKLLTRKGDKREYTVWDILNNTSKSNSGKFYIVIDEAHRGMKKDKAKEKATTILQKFLLGSTEDGLSIMPLVIGMSATPKRFEKLLQGTTHTVHKVYVDPELVKESGLLKERILIHYPEKEEQVDVTLLREATKNWMKMTHRWEKYCDDQEEVMVKPIFVIQIEDGNKKSFTKTNLEIVVKEIEEIAGKINDCEIAHTFNEIGDLVINGHKIKKIEASRIEEDTQIKIVFFKMSLSTGWDCPRAEVMMSFRRAKDHTYIAQLLGRMVRTPLARRINIDSSLNDVHLFLPKFNRESVESVINDLQNLEDVPPSETGTFKELVTLKRRNGTEEIFETLSNSITYRLNTVRRQSAIKRVIGLGRALTHNRIDILALNKVKNRIVSLMEDEINRLSKENKLNEIVENISDLKIQTITYENDSEEIGLIENNRTNLASRDIDYHFDAAGKLFGNGLHMEYWKAHSDSDANKVKLHIIALSRCNECMKNLEIKAQSIFDKIYEESKREIAELKEVEIEKFQKLRLATGNPTPINWHLPKYLDFKRPTGSKAFSKHIFVEEDGRFYASLGGWERGVIEEEIKDKNVVGWFRNLDRKPWSLELPYSVSGKIKSMYPDFVVIRKDKKGLVVDILEPHDSSLKDNIDKAKGMAEFAEKHWDLFGKIQLIRKLQGPDGQGGFYRLDVAKELVRREVLGINSNPQLDKVFDDYGYIK